MMKTPHLHHDCIILALLLAVAYATSAQQLKLYPVQQHKLLWADTVHREAIRKNDSLLLAEAYYLYAKTYEATGDMATSHSWFMKSLAIIEPRGDSYHLARLYHRLAALEVQTGNYAQMRKYAIQALSVSRRIRDNRALSASLATMAQLHRIDWSKMGQNPNLPRSNPDSSLFYTAATEKIRMIESYRDSLALDLMMDKGFKVWEAGQDTSCLVYFKKALTMAAQKNVPRSQYKMMIQIIVVYTTLGIHEKAWNMLQVAENFLKNAIFKDAHQYQLDLQDAQKNYYKAIGDWQNAFEYGEKAYELERNRYISDREGAVTRLNLEYESDKKDAKLKSQQRELALYAANLTVQRRFLITLGALLILAIGTGIAFYRLYRKNRRISLRNAELVREQNHRVKNNLQVISSLLSLQSNQLMDEQARQAVEESQSRVETMAILQRHLYNGEGLIALDVKEFIPQVVKGVLQTYGYNRIKSTLALDSLELSPTKALPIGLIINELITNACKYAFSGSSDPEIKVSCFRQKNKVVLKVSDNGPGIGPMILENKNPTNSFGLKLIRIQVDQLYGTCQFKNDNGTSFQLEFNTE
jgi:two-component sensor histidine kinase